jgi:ubiquinone/menaquinone biosynthesis C-methylase UbiE
MKRRRKAKDIGIEGMAARWYDKNTRKTRLAEMKQYAVIVSSHISDGSSVLEVAPGPGYLAIELARLGRYEITGLDVSKDFVQIARRNAREAGVCVDFRQGNAASIPFPENTFDFLVCTAAFKNFKEPSACLNEMHRVLRRGGTALIVDMDRNASDLQIQEYVRGMGARGAEGVFMKLIFKHFLRKGAYTKQEFVELVSKSSFGDCRLEDKAIGFHAYLRK